ncbi:MAG: sugar phosphate isomerase/epimerase [Sedimentisphaerales bacterium]|nr:sugar phosphate isomerase/epimerase [Sedimentisphaerales bacterium]
MSYETISRRTLLGNLALLAGAAAAGTSGVRARESKRRAPLHLACNQYPWLVFYQREGKDFNKSLDAGLGELASTGMDGYEPLVTNPAEIDMLAPLLKKHKLEMRSLYVNSTLHDEKTAEKSVQEVMAIANKAKTIGTKIIVTNPSPIQWGGPQNKDDKQLIVQGRMLNELGGQLRAAGLTLSYHNHDIELRNAAREFHHMMAGTDPKNVTLCLDAHWVYRGAGNSSVALFDVLKLYGGRITELHLRQSQDNIWSETFAEGDIDYPRLAGYLLESGVRPHMVLEQAVETGTPKTMSTVEALTQSAKYARRVLDGFRG